MLESERLSEHLFTVAATPGPGKELRIFRLAEEISRRRRGLRIAIFRKERRVENRATLATTIGWFLYAFGYAAAIVFVTVLAIGGQATVGDVLLVIALAGQIQEELGSAYGLIGELVLTLRTADHYLWLKDYAEEAMARRHPTSTVPVKLAEGIRFEGVSFRYPGTEVDVLSD